MITEEAVRKIVEKRSTEIPEPRFGSDVDRAWRLNARFIAELADLVYDMDVGYLAASYRDPALMWISRERLLIESDIYLVHLQVVADVMTVWPKTREDRIRNLRPGVCLLIQEMAEHCRVCPLQILPIGIVERLYRLGHILWALFHLDKAEKTE